VTSRLCLPAVLSNTSWRSSPFPRIADWLLAPGVKYILLENLALTKLWSSAIAEMNRAINKTCNLAIPIPVNSYPLFCVKHWWWNGDSLFVFGLWHWPLYIAYKQHYDLLRCTFFPWYWPCHMSEGRAWCCIAQLHWGRLL